MKPVYNNIKPTTGVHLAGLIKILIAPKEWLDAPIVVDFNTNKVLTPATITGIGRSWLTLDLTADSYQFVEKPKNSKAGEFFDCSLNGLVNYIDAPLLQQLETIRFNEVVAIITDKNKRLRIVGDTVKGMNFSFGLKNDNANAGVQEVSIDLLLQLATPAPFYEV